MKKVLKRKWMRALTSGKYEQGHEILRNEYERGKFEFCCLGVLAVVAGGKWSKSGDVCRLGKLRVSIQHNTLLTDKALKMFGLTCEEQLELAQMNDDWKSFKQIAKRIDTMV